MYYLLSGFTRWRYPFVRLFVRRSSTRSEGGGGLSRRPHWLVYCNNCFTGVVRLEYVSAEDLGLLSSGRVLPQAVRGGAEAMTTERDELEQHGREDEDDELDRWPRLWMRHYELRCWQCRLDHRMFKVCCINFPRV